MWMNGSRSDRSTPAKARRTGNPSPSKPRGAVVTERTARVRTLVSGSLTLGSNKMLSTVTAGMEIIPASLKVDRNCADVHPNASWG